MQLTLFTYQPFNALIPRLFITLLCPACYSFVSVQWSEGNLNCKNFHYPCRKYTSNYLNVIYLGLMLLVFPIIIRALFILVYGFKQKTPPGYNVHPHEGEMVIHASLDRVSRLKLYMLVHTNFTVSIYEGLAKCPPRKLLWKNMFPKNFDSTSVLGHQMYLSTQVTLHKVSHCKLFHKIIHLVIRYGINFNLAKCLKTVSSIAESSSEIP